MNAFLNGDIKVLPPSGKFLNDTVRHHHHKHMPLRPRGKTDMDRPHLQGGRKTLSMRRYSMFENLETSEADIDIVPERGPNKAA